MREDGLAAWILTDGKAGDEAQAQGVAEALGARSERRVVRPRAPFAWAAPWGPVDPREHPRAADGPLRPPLPDVVIASGRRTVPHLRALRRLPGAPFTVFLKDPRTGLGAADLIWVPEHDRLRGPNVIATLTAPHRHAAAALAAARANPDPRLAPLPAPRAAVLVGGNSRHHRFGEADAALFLERLGTLAGQASLMITLSRRTPPALRRGIAALAARRGAFLWDGTGENPYRALLALADAVVVTADSHNMVGEAAATGAPLLVFEPSGGHPKLTRFLDALAAKGAVNPFRGRLEGERYEPLDSTPVIAAAIRAALARRRGA